MEVTFWLVQMQVLPLPLPLPFDDLRRESIELLEKKWRR
jgi:hypothetical protein